MSLRPHCDGCGAELNDQKKPHLVIHGRLVLAVNNTGATLFSDGPHHFCNSDCLTRRINNELTAKGYRNLVP